MQSFVDSLFVFPALLLLLLFQIANAATFNLLDDFSGETFFEKWDFYGSYDNLTLGSAHVYSFPLNTRTNHSVLRGCELVRQELRNLKEACFCQFRSKCGYESVYGHRCL